MLRQLRYAPGFSVCIRALFPAGFWPARFSGPVSRSVRFSGPVSRSARFSRPVSWFHAPMNRFPITTLLLARFPVSMLLWGGFPVSILLMNRFPVQPFFHDPVHCHTCRKEQPELPAAILICNIPAEPDCGCRPVDLKFPRVWCTNNGKTHRQIGY